MTRVPPEEFEKRLTLRLPPRLYRMIADTAEMEDVPVNWWIVKTLGAVFSERLTPSLRQSERKTNRGGPTP
jgi:predicted HicB family RNase H-like nuclease